MVDRTRSISVSVQKCSSGAYFRDIAKELSGRVLAACELHVAVGVRQVFLQIARMNGWKKCPTGCEILTSVMTPAVPMLQIRALDKNRKADVQYCAKVLGEVICKEML